MPEQRYRLPGSSYDDLKKIILAYNRSRGKASNDSISKLSGVDPTSVSRNSGFLVESGIVTAGNKKEITSLGSDLAHALEHNIEEEVRSAWRAVFREAPLFETILSAVGIRGGMDPGTLKSHIAYTAGERTVPAEGFNQSIHNRSSNRPAVHY